MSEAKKIGLSKHNTGGFQMIARRSRRSPLSLSLVLVPLLFLTCQGADDTWSCRIPILTVKGSSGSLVYVKVRYSRDVDTSEPLLIAISEQLPQASGDALRASIWQAAMVAALEKKDPLQGVNLHFSIPGQIDGPSAGCVFALAIMSAIEGKTFPTNVAVTGSVLPDGTIGRVGGVHLKIMAAREAKMSRIILPDYSRLEHDLEKDVTVDLKQLARVVGLEFVPVSTVSEAYASLYDEVGTPNRTHDKVELPDELEKYFRQQYEAHADYLLYMLEQNAEKLVSSNLGEEIVTTIVETMTQAEQAASMGYFDVAASLQRDAVHFCLAYLQTLSDFDHEEIIQSIDAVIDERVSSAWRPLELARKAREDNLSSAGVQFLSDIADGRALADYVSILSLSRDEIADAIDHAQNTKSAPQEDIEAAYGQFALVEFTRLLCANLINCFYESYVTNAIDLDASLSYSCGYHVSPRAGVENLLYATYLASKNTLEISFNAACLDAGIDPQEFYIETIIGNPDAAAAFSTYPTEGHERVAKPDLPDREFLSAVMSLSYISSITQASQLLMSTIELDPTYNDDGTITYGRTGLLHHLLRNARRRAIDSVLDCRDNGLPWVAPAMALRHADFSRDDPTTDKVAVLAKYWQASLQANAMALLMQPDHSTKIPSRRPMGRGARVGEVLPTAQSGIKRLSAGDIITHIDRFRIADIDELRAVVASMPEGRKYKVSFVRSTDGKRYYVTAEGGQMLGVSVQTEASPPAQVSDP
jgi:hypothetical protein